jgi:hypothetical protein
MSILGVVLKKDDLAFEPNPFTFVLTPKATSYSSSAPTSIRIHRRCDLE